MLEPGRHRLIQGTPTPISADVSLTLVSVSDSRCPDGVQCIWAGKVDYHLELRNCGRTETFTLSTASQGPGRQPADSAAPAKALASAPGMLVRLAADPPPARGATPLSPVDQVTVELTHR